MRRGPRPDPDRPGNRVLTATLSIRVQARARRNEIVGLRGGVLVMRVTAPALEGRANRAVCRLLAERLGVPASHVTIIRGEHHREKVIRIDGIEQSRAESALGPGGR